MNRQDLSETSQVRRRLTVARMSAVMAAGVGAVLGASWWSASAQAGTSVSVDRQAYVSDEPVDQYQNDAVNIHAGVALGRETARSFVHVDVDALLAQGQVSSLTVSLLPSTGTSDNVGATTPALQACMLTQPLVAPFDASHPPAFDCTIASSTGKVDAQGTWTFDLTGFLPTWVAKGATGAAIVPASTVAATDSWTVSFDKSKSTASGVLQAVAPPTPVAVAPATQVPTEAPTSVSAVIAAPPVQLPAVAIPAPTTAAPALSSTATPAPATTPAAVAAAPVSAPQTPAAAQVATSSARLPGWWWVGLVALLVLVVLAMSSVAVEAAGGIRVTAPSWARTRSNTAALSRTPLVAGIPSGAVIAVVVLLGFTTLAPTNTLTPTDQSGGSLATGPNGSTGADAGGTNGTGGAAAGGGAAATPTPGATGGAAGGTGSAGTGAGAGAVAGSGGTVSGAGHTTTSSSSSSVAPTSAPLYRGVTATTLALGVIDNTDSGAALGSAGFGGAAIGDGKAQANAVLADINAHGGIAGHHVNPVFHDVSTASLASDPSGSGQQACIDLTSQGVFAAVIPLSVSDANTLACFAHHDTPVIVDNTSGYDTVEMNQFLSYMYVPAALNLTRASQTLVAELGSEGYLTPTGVYGVVAPDLPEYHRAFDQGLVPALAQRNITVKDKVFYTGNNSTADFQNGVVNFFSEGIDHVISLGKQSQITFFMIAAEKQQFRPRYALSSFDNPQLLETTAPKAQLANAVGAGWNPIIDNDTSHSIGPVNANAQRCTNDMNAAGVSNSTGNAVASAFDMCDVFFFLQTALTSPSQLSSAGLLQAANALGSSYAAPDTFQVTMSSRKHDGASAVRDLAFDSSCSCFLYRGGTKASQ
jgi:hypothetical protein